MCDLCIPELDPRRGAYWRRDSGRVSDNETVVYNGASTGLRFLDQLDTLGHFVDNMRRAFSLYVLR